MSPSPSISPSRPESCLLQTRDGSFPVTPARTSQILGQTTTPDNNDRPTPTPSIRDRRGRRQVLANGTFRPLSVFTKSLLLPFDLDTDKALEILKGDSPHRLEEARIVLSPKPKSREDTDEENQPEKQETYGTPKLTPSSRHVSAAIMETSTFTRNFQMDLITALKTTSPEKDVASPAEVQADFTTLCELPVPEPSLHPASSSSPFDVKTDLPLLFTSTSIDEIRSCNNKNNKHRESSSKSGKESIERKRSLFGLDLRTPSSARSRNASSTSEDSPLPVSIITPSASNPFGSVKGSSPLTWDFATPKDTASSTSTSGSVRKFSDLFRKKDSMERSLDSPSWSPRESMDSPNLNRHDLERYLRRTTNTPTFDYDPYSSYPRHPNTGRGWKSRNLKCTNCMEQSCGVCHRVCCAFRAAVVALETHKEGSPGRPMALQRIQEITKVFPYGKETPTFLQCTTGGGEDQAGCAQLVCPDCCSICPDDVCADILCRKCKAAMWEECDWHRGDVLVLQYQRW